MTAPCTPRPVVRCGVFTAEGKLLSTWPTREQANGFLWAGSERYVAEVVDDGVRE
jgi:hypothetical protein